MNGSELQGQGYARVIYHDRGEEHEGSNCEEVTCHSSSESLTTESRWRVVAGINYRNNLEQPIHWASRFFRNISLLFPASIKLALEMEWISCISDLAAFDLKPKTTWWPEELHDESEEPVRSILMKNSFKMPTAKENFSYSVAITCYFLPWKHVWQHNNRAICYLSYCMRLHAAASLRARHNPAFWQITIA